MKKTLSHYITFTSVLLFFIVKTSVGQEKPSPSCGCDDLWATASAQEFVKDLEKAGSSNHPVWLDFELGDGAIVLDAGLNEQGQHCLGLWKKGKVLSYQCLADKPKMLTQLYSYYLNYKEPITSPVPEAFFTTKASPDFVNWMNDLDIETAVYMPVDFPKFPFKISSLVKTQIAVHESFHIEVQLRKWYTDQGNWPAWDKQPKRGEILQCYTHSDAVKSLIEQELARLNQVISNLLDNKKGEVCASGKAFLELRRERYSALNNIKVEQADGLPGSCEVAEAIMEAEEGIADYASWTKLFDIGMADRNALLKRYSAQQKDHFYLTGAMLLHAIMLMSDETEEKVLMKFITSKTTNQGSLTNLFGIALANYCN